MFVTKDNITELAWEKMDNLIPAIIQHESTGAILMQGYMNQNSLLATLETGKATFYSRSKKRSLDKRRNIGQFFSG
jgi:phosphoribosyl-ATP pyrophosphohydrolase/phosphoribosyl-AMP cyclohydrolase